MFIYSIFIGCTKGCLLHILFTYIIGETGYNSNSDIVFEGAEQFIIIRFWNTQKIQKPLAKFDL